MHNLKSLLVIVLLFIAATFCPAQKINYMGLTPRTTTLFDMSAVTLAGGCPASVTENTAWFNYSIRDNTGLLYTLAVSTTPGTIPPGIDIHAEAGPFVGTGQAGQPTGPKLLSSVPASLVVNMGQGTTGVGQSCGHYIKLTISITDIALLHPGNYPLTLVYTLTAQ